MSNLSHLPDAELEVTEIRHGIRLLLDKCLLSDNILQLSKLKVKREAADGSFSAEWIKNSRAFGRPQNPRYPGVYWTYGGA